MFLINVSKLVNKHIKTHFFNTGKQGVVASRGLIMFSLERAMRLVENWIKYLIKTFVGTLHECSTVANTKCTDAATTTMH